MLFPNKIYTLEFQGENMIGGQSHIVVTVAASDKETAQDWVKKKTGVDVEPVCLMNAVYPTIYVQNGSVPEQVQAKILSLNTVHWD